MLWHAAAVDDAAICAVVDDDLRSALGEPAPSGPAPAAPLTARQRKTMEVLLQRHGQDFEAMVKDTKLNRALLPMGKLRRMAAAFDLYPENARVRFQQPKRKLT